MSGQRFIVGIWTDADASTVEFGRILAGNGYAVIAAPPEPENWASADLIFIDAATATRYAPVIDALKQRHANVFLPTVVVLPAGADSAPWLDDGFDDVVRLPAQRSEVLARLRVLLRLRAQSQRADRVSATRSHMIVDSSIDAVAAVDHRGCIVDFNPAAERMFQQAREAMLGKPFTLLAQPALRTRYAESFHRYVVTGRSRMPGRRTELRAVRANGETFPAELSLTRIDGHDGPGFFAFVRDLTEQKRAERDLAHLAAIVESSEEAIIGQALDGTITSWNKGAERLFGYPAEEAIGRAIDMLDPPSSVQGGALPRGRITHGRRHVDLDAVRVRKDGSLAEVGIRVSPIMTRDGVVIGSSTIAYDIAARRRERMALRASERRYRSLVAATTSVVWTSDGEGRFIYPQPSWEAYTGQPWPKHQGLGWLSMLHADDRLGVSQRWTAAIAARRIFEEPCRLWHAPSEAFHHAILRAVPIRHGDGSVTECIGTITDVDDTKRAEQAIHALNQELEQRVAERTADLAKAKREQ
jgi:PAS domain S-box-containing protein